MRRRNGYAIGLLLITGFFGGTAQASETRVASDYGKPSDFLEDVQHAQISHVAIATSGTVTPSPRNQEWQAFGTTGGILNDIWRNHFGQRSESLRALGTTTTAAGIHAAPSGFLDDVRRSHFKHLGV